MDREEMFQAQKMYSEQGLFLYRDLMPRMVPIMTGGDWIQEERNTLLALLAATARSSESTFLLCAYGQLWDAEMVVRSLFEGTLKFVYILQNKAEFKERYKEYSEDLFHVALLKKHRQAKELLELLPNANSEKWKPFQEMLMSDDEATKLGDRYPRSERRRLETKWGFAGLIGALSRSGDPVFSKLAGLAHGYAIGSHLQHADYIGVHVPLNMDSRDESRRETAHFAHLSRLISDVLTCFELRLAIGYRYLDLNSKPVAETISQIKTFNEGKNHLYEKWMNVEYRDSK